MSHLIDFTKKIEHDPLSPIQLLVIFGKRDSVQFNYPGDFLDEITLEEKIWPRTPDEIERVITQSGLTCIKGGMRFTFKNGGIDEILKFNGKTARSGLSLEVFQERVRAKQRDGEAK